MIGRLRRRGLGVGSASAAAAAGSIRTCSQFRVRRVACGLSGGVDSTVSALLLKRAGFEVVGVFMKNWDVPDEVGDATPACPLDRDAEDAEKVCRQLGIAFKQANFVKEYWQDVFDGLIADYRRGVTPNPDVECNRHLKFGHFRDYCLNDLGVDGVATGHYARLAVDQEGLCHLLQAVDKVKDQTLFLSQVRQESLRNTLFPVGGLLKGRVKQLAAESGFGWVARKRESMGICFVGKRRRSFAEFIEDYVEPEPGPFVDVETGREVGRHRGVHQWTVGQRVRLGGMLERMYVVDRDAASRTIKVCRTENHPALLADTFFTGEPHWICGGAGAGDGGRRSPRTSSDRPLLLGRWSLECDFRFQNTQPLSRCVITARTSGALSSRNWEYPSFGNGLTVSTAEPQRALTAGQYAAFYAGEECLGSAKIERVGPSHYSMDRNRCRTTAKTRRKDPPPDEPGPPGTAAAEDVVPV